MRLNAAFSHIKPVKYLVTDKLLCVTRWRPVRVQVLLSPTILLPTVRSYSHTLTLNILLWTFASIQDSL